MVLWLSFRDTDINVPGCINITTTVCNLVHHFSTENPFSMNEHFRVSFFSSARTDVKGETGMKTFNNHYVGMMLRNKDLRKNKISNKIEVPTISIGSSSQ